MTTYEETRRRTAGLIDAVLTYVTEDAKRDDDRIVVLDDGQASGVRIERYPRWLEFDAGDVALGVNLEVAQNVEDGPIGLYTDRCEIDGPWTLESLRALHCDLGRLLADARLPGAMDEAWAYYHAHPTP